jgi:hypothetical protein
MDARIKSGHDECACVQTNHNFKQRVSQIQFRGLAARFARVLLSSSRPLQSEGAGNAGRPMRPIAACAMIVVERTRVSQVTPESPSISPRNGFNGFLRALPGDRLSCHRRPRKLPFANLTPASGRQDHTTSPSASSAARLRAASVHRILSRVRDDLEPPLSVGQDGWAYATDLRQASSNISEIQKSTKYRSLTHGLRRANGAPGMTDSHKKDATGWLPSRPNLCKLAGPGLRAPRCQAQESLAGDPSEVTALGVRHWITSFRC